MVLSFNQRLSVYMDVVQKITEFRNKLHGKKISSFEFNDIYDQIKKEIDDIAKKYNIGIDKRIILMSQEDYDLHVEFGTISEFVVNGNGVI